MKKMFFTAIAMIAFSSVSMANTIAEEEVVKENLEKKVDVHTTDDCAGMKFAAYVQSRADGFSKEDARDNSWHIYYWCMGTASNAQAQSN